MNKPQVRVLIADALRFRTGGREEFSARGDTVAEALADMDGRYPLSTEQLLTDSGDRLREKAAILIKKRKIQGLRGLETKLRTGAEVVIRFAWTRAKPAWASARCRRRAAPESHCSVKRKTCWIS